MPRSTGLPTGALLGLLLLSFQAVAAPPPRALASRLGEIESAFRGSDARRLRSYCPSAGRVRLEVKDVAAAQGPVGTGQFEMLFRQVFEEAPSTAFAFDRDGVRLSPPATAFARARWTRSARDGRSLEDTLTFTLRDEGDDWRIEEIRSTR